MSNLIIRSILGLAFLLAVLGLILFGFAGTLNFWQAWVYLATFGICTLLITLYLVQYDQKLLASRVAAGPTAETQKSQQVIQSLASLFFIGLYVVSGLDFRNHWSSVPQIVSIIADGFVILGFYVVFRVFRENTYTSATIEVKDEQKVISTGPYSLVRHPMYAGAFLLLIFTPVALGSWVAIPFVLPLIGVIIVRLLDEEKFLLANLPGYAAYREKVRYRLVPGVW
jgi:protein-S-isoprenylcysteine O-methyltransferase Ste14